MIVGLFPLRTPLTNPLLRPLLRPLLGPLLTTTLVLRLFLRGTVLERTTSDGSTSVSKNSDLFKRLFDAVFLTLADVDDATMEDAVAVAGAAAVADEAAVNSVCFFVNETT